LDGFRRGFLLELAARTPQAIITGTEAPDNATRLYTIHAGKLERVQS
jgi:hypothetical protein